MHLTYLKLAALFPNIDNQKIAEVMERDFTLEEMSTYTGTNLKY